MPLGKSEYNCLWIKSGYMMTILSQQFFFHNRYSKYQQMVCEGIIEPEKLPSIELTAWFHRLRVHLQIIQWKILDEYLNLDPRTWGWKLVN